MLCAVLDQFYVGMVTCTVYVLYFWILNKSETVWSNLALISCCRPSMMINSSLKRKSIVLAQNEQEPGVPNA